MKTTTLLTSVVLAATLALPAAAADLRIGLADDPDTLDPDQSRTFVGEIVMASMCDKLVGIAPDASIIQQLATEWAYAEDGMSLTMTLRKGVTFQDGSSFTAEDVVRNIERSRELPESRRKSELTSIASVTADAEDQVTFHLNAPDATLLARLAARSGIMVSPEVAEEAGANFGSEPVCIGPYKFRERVQQERIVLEKDPTYYAASDFHFDTVTYLPIPDATVRLANLRSGDLDLVERVATSDVATVQGDPSLSYAEVQSLGYQGIVVNVANGAGAGEDNPLSQHAELRRALSLSIDREALNQVVFDGLFTPGNQPFAPGSTWYDADTPMPMRDVEEARRLMASVGVETLDMTLTVPNNPISQQVGQVIQAMASEVGFNIEIQALEFATLLSSQTAGDYQADLSGWSGYVDPDANLNQMVTCAGGINDTRYCNEEVDQLLNDARSATDPAERKASYDAARKILDQAQPLIYLYHPTWIWGLDANVKGFTPYPDGLIRLSGVRAE